MKYFSVRNRAIPSAYFFIHAASNHVQDSPERDVRMVEDRSFEGVQPRTSLSRGTAGPTTGWSPFSRKGISKRNYVRLTAPRKTLQVSSASCAIKHSNVAQLSLPRTWSERGTANLLDSEVLLVVKSRVLSSGFQRRSWYILCISILLVFEPVYILR